MARTLGKSIDWSLCWAWSWGARCDIRWPAARRVCRSRRYVSVSASLTDYFLKILKTINNVIFTSVLRNVTWQLCDIKVVKTLILSVEKPQNLYHQFKGRHYFKIDIYKIGNNYVVMLQNVFQFFLSHISQHTPTAMSCNSTTFLSGIIFWPVLVIISIYLAT